MKPRRNLFLGSLLVISMVQAAQATTYWWDTFIGSWGTGANWSDAASGGTTGTVPLAGDSVIFNQSPVNGASTVTLDAARSIAGITFNNTGTTAITNGAGANTLTLGTGGVTIASGAGAVTLNSAIKLDGNQTWSNASTTNPFLVSSTITNVGDTTPYTLAIGGAGNTQINGVISNGGTTGTTALVKSGLGTLTLGSISGVANTFSGGLTINGGTVLVTSAGVNGVGTGAIAINSGTLQFNTSTRGNTNTISNTFTGSGTLKLYSSPMLTATGFAMAASNFSGFTGTIQVTNNGANGSEGGKFNAGTGTFNASGAILQLDSGAQLYYAGTSNTATFGTIYVSGNGGNEGRGAFRIESGTLAGNIILQGNSVWGQATGVTGNIKGTATLGNTQVLTLGAVNQGGGTLSGIISDGTDGGKLALTKRRSDTVTLSGASASTYTGDTTVTGGTLALNLNNMGTPTDLISSSSKLVLGGGTLTVTGKSTAVASSQTFASTTLNSGNNTVTTTLGTGGTSTTLALQAITRNTGALLRITNASGAAPNTTTLITRTSGINGAGLPGSTSYFGAWAAYGSGAGGIHLLQLDSSGNFVAGPAETTASATNITSDSTVYKLTTADLTVSNNSTAYAIFGNTASSQTLGLGTYGLTTNGIYNISTSGNSGGWTVTGSTGITVGTENELVLSALVGSVKIPYTDCQQIGQQFKCDNQR